MAFTEEDIKRLIETYLNSNSVVLSGLEKNDTDDDIWVFGTQETSTGKKSVRIKLSDLKGGKGEDGETTQEVSIYKKSDTHPEAPAGIVDGTGLPPEGWMLKQESKEGVWWVSKGTFVINPDKIYDEDPKIRYGRMIGGWSLPNKITTTDGSTTTTAHRYYSSLSSTDAPKIKRNELEPTTPGWKTEYMLSNNPNMGLEHINDQSKPAEYNQFLGENSVFLWEIEGQILNDEQLIGLWSNPFLKTPPPTGEKPETPILTTVLNIETSSYLMECDPDTFKALPNQSITITAKPQNFKDLEVGDVKFTMVPYNVGGNPINSIPLDVDIWDSELPTTIITNSNWGDEYAKVEITCTIKNRSATTTIHRHTNTKYGDSVVFGYLQPPSKNFASDDDGLIPEEKYIGFRGQFVLIDAGDTIIDREVDNSDVEFNFKNVTPGLVMAIVENGKWKSNNSEHDINGTDAGEEGDGTFKIIDYSRASDFMGVTIVSKYRNIKYPLPFSINKIKEFDPTNPPPQNTDTDESIYTLTKGYRIPEITIKDDYLTSERYIADNFIPDKIKDGDNVTWAPDYITWAGNPLNVDVIFDHLWRSDRVKTNGVWRAFDTPYLWTNYSKPPEIDPNSRLQVFLENGFEFFSGNKGDKAEVFVRSFLDVSPQGISKICVGDSLDGEGNPKIEGTYDEFFDFKIDSTEDKITFTLNRDNDEAKNSFIPINVTVNGKDFGLQFKYVIAPRTELRTILELTTTSSVIARDLTDDSSYQKDSTPKFIEVVGHHLNVDNLEWSYRIDGVGEYNSITTSTVGLSVRDNVVTITTPELVVSNTLEIMLKGKTIPDGYETFDVIGITVINHGRTGIPGKMPFTRGVWKEGDSYRNNLSVVDYVYYRDYTTPGRNGWFRLSDSYLEHVADATPYEDTAGNTTSTVIRKNTDGEDIYVKIDSLGAKAFDLVIAEEANLAGFIFKNNVLQSQDDTTIDNIRYPNLILDGVKGKITALDAVIKGEITATRGYIGDLKVKGGYLEGYKRVKRPGQEDELINTMGLNANNGEGKDNIAFWAGGSLNDIDIYDTKPKDQRTGDESFAYIKHNGRAFFTNADISGKMTATEGTIGGFDIVGDTLVGSYKNEDDDFVQTVGLIANADIHKTNRGVAFWAGTPNGGNLKTNARIMHDGKAFFTGAEISGNITATSGYIGNFKIEGGYLIGHYKDVNDVLVATTGLNANRTARLDPNNPLSPMTNIAFWAGGSLAEVFDKANQEPIPDNKDSIAYITHDGKAFFNNMEIEGKITATSGKIGSWKIEGGGLTSKDFDGVNRSFIKLEETGGRFLRINESASSMIGIRADNGTALSIYTQDTGGTGINILAQTGSKAIVSRGSHDFYQRHSEYWNAPGVLAVVTFKLAGFSDQFPSVSSFEEKWCINSLEPSAAYKLTVKQITRNKFRFTHNLGHMDYAPIGFMGAASDGVVNQFIKNTSYCDVELGGSWTTRIATVTIVLFGRNRQHV